MEVWLSAVVTQPSARPAPTRTCVGCRQKATAAELLRVVARSGTTPQDSWYAAPDPRRRAPGRGAHLHPTETCLARAEKSRAFTRALRHDAATYGPLDLEVLRQHLLRETTSSTTGTTQHDPPRPTETGSISS